MNISAFSTSRLHSPTFGNAIVDTKRRVVDDDKDMTAKQMLLGATGATAAASASFKINAMKIASNAGKASLESNKLLSQAVETTGKQVQNFQGFVESVAKNLDNTKMLKWAAPVLNNRSVKQVLGTVLAVGSFSIMGAQLILGSSILKSQIDKLD